MAGRSEGHQALAGARGCRARRLTIWSILDAHYTKDLEPESVVLASVLEDGSAKLYSLITAGQGAFGRRPTSGLTGQIHPSDC